MRVWMIEVRWAGPKMTSELAVYSRQWRPMLAQDNPCYNTRKHARDRAAILNKAHSDAKIWEFRTREYVRKESS